MDDTKERKDLKDTKEVKAKDPKEKVIKDNAKSHGGPGGSGGATGGSKKKKTGKSRRDLKFDGFIHKVLKQVHPNIGITKQGMTVMNDLVCNAFYQIAEEAGKLVKMDNRDTLAARDINCAVRLILPGELAQHSNDEGSSALKHFESNNKKQNIHD